MKCARIIAAFILLLVGAAGAQTSYTVEVGKTLQVETPGATAAYAVVSSIADASYYNGLVRIVGVDAGKTTIIVITPAGMKTLAVEVKRPVPAGASESVVRQEFGNYSFQYSSDPQQVTNGLDYTRQFGSSFQRLQLSNTAFLTQSSGMESMPIMSLQLHTPTREVTFLDDRVSNSALTVDQVPIRGLHLKWNDWELHAGYASMLTYQNVLLATDPEYVFGLSRQFRISKSVTLLVNAYYFSNPANSQTATHNGPIGSFAYRYHRGQHLEAKAEIGIGATPALALSVLDEDSQRHLSANFRVVPAQFSAVALNSQHGTFGDLQYTGVINSKYSVAVTSNLSNYDLPQMQDKLFTIGSNLSRTLTDRVSVNTGSTYSYYSSVSPTPSTFQSLNLSMGMNFHTHFFNVNAQYLPTTDFVGHFASGYAFGGSVPIHHFQLLATYQHQVEIPSVTSILAEVPDLQQLLLQAGITVTSLDQLLALLNNSTELNALGFSNLIGLDLSTTRDDFSAGLNWSSSHKQASRLSVTFDDSRSIMPGQNSLHYRSETAVYTRKIGSADELSAAVSIYQSDMAGASNVQPSFQIAYRHPLRALPIPLLLKHHGMISGHAFYDPASTSRYSSSLRGVNGAEVWLDGKQRTRTDARGYYSFANVPYGDHRVELKYSSSEPYFFTTDSRSTVPINSMVDFGLNFVQGHIFGVVHNDAGGPIPGILVTLRGEGISQRMLSGGDGSFQFRGLPAGTYTLTTDPVSYPPGFDLQDIEEKTVSLTTDTPSKLEFKTRALRSISGEVTVFDTKLLKQVPVSGAVVRIVELGIQTHSDANGRYMLRRVTPGTFTVVAEQNGAKGTQKVEVPQQPGEIKDVNFMLQRR